MAQTLFDKIWNNHFISKNAGFPDTLYIDVHLINKITISEDISPGNYGIDLSRIIHSKPMSQRSELIGHDVAAIIAGHNDTDYLLNHTERIKECESSKFYRIFNGA
jgi:homoaconitase/3-isopropylmalate dehydratase large subunit